MAEKRCNYRHPKRLPVKFGVGIASVSGFTEDLSHFGLFIKTGAVYGPGQELVVELNLQQEFLIRIVVKVRWAKKVPPALLRSYKGGMGFTIIRFLEGEEYYRAFCDELQQIRAERNNFGAKGLVCNLE